MMERAIGERWAMARADALDFLRRQPTASVDALITDGPYSSGGMTRADRTQPTSAKYTSSDSANQAIDDFAGDNRDQRAFRYWCALWIAECWRIVKPGGVAALFTDWRQLPSTSDALQAGGFVWRGLVPWHKKNSRPQKGRFGAACEYVVWGSHGQMPMRGPCLPGFYEYPPPRQREHQTQKPLALLRDIVKICPEGGVVLDPFAGRGTTGIAALLAGRRFIGCEITDHFFKLSRINLERAEARSIAESSTNHHA